MFSHDPIHKISVELENIKNHFPPKHLSIPSFFFFLKLFTALCDYMNLSKNSVLATTQIVSNNWKIFSLHNNYLAYVPAILEHISC